MKALRHGEGYALAIYTFVFWRKFLNAAAAGKLPGNYQQVFWVLLAIYAVAGLALYGVFQLIEKLWHKSAN